MAKIKFTKGELKRQRDALRQYQRYLPTLQLKKQQLQMEILRQVSLLEERRHALQAKTRSVLEWSGLLGEINFDLRAYLLPRQVIKDKKNIAGVDLPVFSRLEFADTDYDLFLTPLWLDRGIEFLREIAGLRAEIAVIEQGVGILRQELRVATQRVNLFEKVKIPQAEEGIRLIKIYLGDQMTNAVGRSKIAKKKIENLLLEEVAV
ncbi:MAG: V-type ATP synthase subunit D [Candidatus Omnitrophica bacterium]|nr:V-type ATP synthase subunit D [Candidatus Omnitrophota bacterium]MDD5512603.1 V-type ATP synthase subunit D [Candidatus Omnitrophota bacterium]